jgi:hypothetical protein
MSAGMIYVCDNCGHIEIRDAVPEGGAWTCCNCETHAAWEFPPERRAYAETHAAHIRRLPDTGLIRRVRA